jgi:hypothetical protein
MTDEPFAVALLVVGGIVAAAAIAATSSLATASAVAAAGTGIAAFGLVLLVAPIVRRPPVRLEAPVGSSLVQLRESFRSGPLGRQAIIATVVTLERAASGEAFGRVTPEEERRLVAADPAEFRAWLDARLASLEKGT